MSTEEKVLFNIWDDYWDDNTGEDQETYGYCESDQTELEQEEMCVLISDWINENIKLPEGLLVYSEEDSVQFENMTHEFLENTLLPLLKQSQLKFQGTLIDFYSES